MIGVTVAGASAPIPLATAGVRDVEAEVRTALEGYRSKLRDRCLGDAATDPSYEGSWTFNYTFAPDGSQIIRGVTEHGPDASARPSVTRCVLDALPPLRIPPPNATVRVDVAFSLP